MNIGCRQQGDFSERPSCSKECRSARNRAQHLLQAALVSARLSGRYAVLKILAKGSHRLAAIDQGQNIMEDIRSIVNMEILSKVHSARSLGTQ